MDVKELLLLHRFRLQCQLWPSYFLDEVHLKRQEDQKRCPVLIVTLWSSTSNWTWQHPGNRAVCQIPLFWQIPYLASQSRICVGHRGFCALLNQHQHIQSRVWSTASPYPATPPANLQVRPLYCNKESNNNILPHLSLTTISITVERPPFQLLNTG